jgi:hypothetical protein
MVSLLWKKQKNKCCEWYKRFQDGREDVEDDECSDENVKNEL